MSFFYDLNKRLATLASKQDAKQISEDAKATAPKSQLAESMDVAEAGYSAKRAAAGKDIGKPGKNFAKIAKSAGKEYGSKEAGERVAGAVLNKLRHAKEGVEESASQQDWQKKYDAMMKTPHGRKAIAAAEKDRDPHSINKAVEKHYARVKESDTDGDVMDYLNHELKDYDAEQTKEGNAFTGKLKSTPKGGKFKLGNKEFKDTSSLDEDEKMAEGVSRKHFQAIADTLRHIEDMDKRRELAQHHASAFKLANPRFDQARFFKAAGLDEADMSGLEEGYAEMDAWLKNREKEKGTGRFDSRKVSTGTVYTRKPETFDDPETDPEATGGAPKRKGRPAGTRRAIGAKHSGRSKLASKDAIAEEGAECCPHCGHELVAEKSVSQAQAHMMAGAAHNPEFAKKVGVKKSVAKEFNQADKGKDISKLPKHVKKTDEEKTSTKDDHAERAGKRVAKDIEHDEGHKGKDDNRAEKAGKKVTKDIEYDDKKDKKEKKVDETSDTPKASKGGMQFGKGVYESLDRKLETMITEGMNISVNMNTDEQGEAQKSITVSATGADADRLADLLKMAGLEQTEETCPTCGSSDCECGEEELEENNPDWPTKKETTGNNDANQRRWSGGLNGPKSTGQTTVPVIAGQGRQSSMEESVKLERNLFNLFQNYKAK